ncbi:hypothetical protein OFO01_04470 [Campylobacter sp. JMF_01 NE2]|uniref:hypothetical protein n=1 Tax=unclassified Campylobacter TaxID=2593542 RepID=UPI0022E9C98F|nr:MULTISPECIES: hypothetical protein [unclassified Campylobacter]MDA3052704.1 hypothetical protein [Campylobacter sp. JMF_03 NE3]MDA3067035.1 hypothetical protein [Campylobacter sp. JMF_01 NE2]
MIKEYKSEAGFEMALKTRRIIRLKNGGFVKNDSMPRVDIFAHKQTGKFYGVPIYAMDFALGVLPNRAAVQGKDKNGVMKDWLEMDENYEFKFSLFPNDLIAVQKSGMENPILCYYEGFGITTAQIRVAKHSNNKADLTSDEIKIYGDISKKDKVEQPSLGIQGLQIFEKMKVSPLGEISACKFEPRQGVKLKSSPKFPNKG